MLWIMSLANVFYLDEHINVLITIIVAMYYNFKRVTGK